MIAEAIVTRVTSGYDYEEIQKVWIVGELANRMLMKSGYPDTVILDFVHCYGNKVSPEYYLSVGDGVILTEDENQFIAFPPLVSRPTVVVVRQRSTIFDIKGTLRLLEFGIQHHGELGEKQRPISYSIGITLGTVESIDTSETRRIATSRTSAAIDQVMQTKVYRQGDSTWESEGGITYCWLGGKNYVQIRRFYVLTNDTNCTERHSDTTVLVTPTMYQFAAHRGPGRFVFDSESTFCYVSFMGMNLLSQKH